MIDTSPRSKVRGGRLGGPLAAILILLAMTTPAGGVDQPLADAAVLNAEEALRVDAETYSEQFGVSIDEALNRLALQPIAGEAAQSLETLVPDRLAGAWLEHEPTFKLVVRFVGEDVGLDDAKATVAASDVPVEYQFGAERTLAELDEGEDALALVVAKTYPAMSMYIDFRAGVVTLRGPTPIDEATLAKLADAAGVPVAAELADEVVTLAGYGGRKIDTGLGGCTTGFSVRDAVSGLTGVLTAGHCAEGAQSAATYHDADGTFDIVTMSGTRWDSNQDFAWYQTPGNDWPQF